MLKRRRLAEETDVGVAAVVFQRSNVVVEAAAKASPVSSVPSQKPGKQDGVPQNDPDRGRRSHQALRHIDTENMACARLMMFFINRKTSNIIATFTTSSIFS